MAKGNTATASKKGSVWDNDKALGGDRLDETYELGDKFILYGMEVVTDDSGDAIEIDTSVGKAKKAILDTAPVLNPDDRKKVGTLASAIVSKAEESSESDFPVIVELKKVHSKQYETDALVIQWVADYDPASDKPPF